MGKKRGQVTVFIIVGIVLLFFLAAFLYFRGQDISIVEEVLPVPAEFKPIQLFVEECVQTQTVDALMLAGMQAGYVYIPPKIEMNPAAFISLTRDSLIKLPFWYYKGENRVPSLTYIQDDISRYVKENLPVCLNDFSAFKNKFEITPLEEINAESFIADEGVKVKVTYPLQIKLKGADKSAEINSFSSTVELEFKRMMELAAQIMETENKEMFFEDATLDLMTLGPGEPPDGVPFTDMLFGVCGRLRWDKRAVLETIKDRLYYNLPRISIENTNYPAFASNDVYGIHHFKWFVTGKDYSDLNVGTIFSRDWPVLFNVRPSKGNTMLSSYGQGSKDYLRFICINGYHFTYDLVYPVEMIITDSNAFDKRGYVFRFAFPIMIDHNKGTREDFDINIYESPEPPDDTDACESRREETFIIYATDAKTGYNILGANVTFDCMTLMQCPLGETRTEMNVGRLTTNLPNFCQPGSIIVSHPDYAKEKQQLIDEKNYIDIEMKPVRKFKFEVMKQRMINNKLQEATPLDENEFAVLMLSSDEAFEFDYSREYPFVKDTSAEMKTIPLIRDNINYTLHIALVDQNYNYIGGAAMEWTPDPEDIESSNKIIFKVIEYIPHPVDTEGQLDMSLALENINITKELDHEFVVG